jgi:small-conductance mechanosensitive channel
MSGEFASSNGWHGLPLAIIKDAQSDAGDAVILSLLAQAGTTMPEAMYATRTGLIDVIRPAFARLAERVMPIMSELVNVPDELARAVGRILAEEPALVTRRVVSLIAILAAMYLCSVLARRWAAGRLAPPEGASAPEAIIRRFGVDVAGALAMLAVALIGNELLIVRSGLAPSLTRALVDLGALLGFALIVPAILFRPGEPELRLLHASEAQIAASYPPLVATLLIGISFPVVIPIILEANMSWPAAQALAVTVGLATGCLLGLTIFRFFQAADPRPRWGWRHVSVVVGLAFWLTWSYGVINLDFPFYFFMVRLGAILTVALIASRLFAAGLRPIPDGHGSEAFSRFWKCYGRPLQRMAYAVMISALVLSAMRWLVEIEPAFVATARLAAIELALWRAVAVVLSAYIAFELLSAWTRERYAPPPLSRPGSDDEELAPASRLHTVVPLLQGAIGVTMLGIAILTAMSQLGLDTTPLLAGAGIVGLAFSFGSQSLVRDIVAGVFYMTDDAFRLGEYIEAGRLKGNVEKITVRSVQVRHHNGQLHTIPLGQLGAVTNYSRDWLTMKFNLRLARSVDFETVRKTAKKVGLDLMQDGEFGKEFILPLKLQGVADIEENALVMRFKFTVRPGKPAYVQREAVKRLMRAFAEKDIAFAQHSVVVQTSSPRDDAIEAAAAAGEIERVPPRMSPSREVTT